jgi:hypothetical protein
MGKRRKQKKGGRTCEIRRRRKWKEEKIAADNVQEQEELKMWLEEKT